MRRFAHCPSSKKILKLLTRTPLKWNRYPEYNSLKARLLSKPYYVKHCGEMGIENITNLCVKWYHQYEQSIKLNGNFIIDDSFLNDTKSNWQVDGKIQLHHVTLGCKIVSAISVKCHADYWGDKLCIYIFFVWFFVFCLLLKFGCLFVCLLAC